MQTPASDGATSGADGQPPALALSRYCAACELELGPETEILPEFPLPALRRKRVLVPLQKPDISRRAITAA